MSTIIILAMVFVFVALRLWSVLGRRTGHEQPLAKPESVPSSRSLFARGPAEAAPVSIELPANAPGATAGLRTIASADSTFDLARFVEGARAAYKMLLEAYWAGDEARLNELVDGEVADAFAAAIRDRKAQGLVLDNRLVSIDATHVEDAGVEAQTAYIRVRFDADVAAVTRDADGNVVAGSLEDAGPTHDVWTFSRALKSSDPNWTLTETDEAA